jgi:hypothetical protein
VSEELSQDREFLGPGEGADGAAGTELVEKLDGDVVEMFRVARTGEIPKCLDNTPIFSESRWREVCAC